MKEHELWHELRTRVLSFEDRLDYLQHRYPAGTEVHECPNCKHRTLNEERPMFEYPSIREGQVYMCLTCGTIHCEDSEKRYKPL